jgi:hypothetical protein
MTVLCARKAKSREETQEQHIAQQNGSKQFITKFITKQFMITTKCDVGKIYFG